MALTLSACGRINYEPLAKEDAETTSLQPLVQYAMDEAESGQAPAELVDLATSPLNMPIFYGESSPVFDVGSGGGRHLHFFGNGHTGGGVVAINGTKVDALHGSSTATLEVVHQLDLCDQANDQQRVFGMGNGNNATTDGWLTSRVMPEGEIIAVGSGARDESGKLVPLDVKVGDRVLFGKWSGTEVKLNDEDLLIMKESDIMGVIA